MNSMERAAMNHVAEEMAYRRSPQCKIDRDKDREQRAERDRKAGHSPFCSLTKCHPTCKQAEKEIK